MGQWRGDYSRNLFQHSRLNQYIKTRMQQGHRPLVDADQNDNTDLLYEHTRAFIEKYIGQVVFEQMAWKIIGDGSVNNFYIFEGSAWIHGHEALNAASVYYQNNGDNQAKLNIYSVSTDLSDTVLTDTAMKWTPGELVGRYLQPNVKDNTVYEIIDNTETTITVVAGSDMTAHASVGDSYNILLSTPSANRTDTVWLNVYLDEIDSTEDSMLLHPLGSGIESELRVKVRTIVQVEEGSETYTDYVDSDGNQHYLVKLANINRPAGDANIQNAYIDDNRLSYMSAGGAVMTYGDQLVNGVKTFTSFPLLPTIDPTDDYQAVHKKYVDTRIATISAPILYREERTDGLSVGTSAETDIFVPYSCTLFQNEFWVIAATLELSMQSSDYALGGIFRIYKDGSLYYSHKERQNPSNVSDSQIGMSLIVSFQFNAGESINLNRFTYYVPSYTSTVSIGQRILTIMRFAI